MIQGSSICMKLGDVSTAVLFRDGARRHPISAQDLRLGMTYSLAGFAPITSLALSVLGVVPLYVGAVLFVVPSILVAGLLAFRHPLHGRLAAQGVIMGILAVLLYDCTRLPFILAGVWGDFIPDIAKYLLNRSEPNWLIGYGWRYLGNGGGMGMAFVVAYGIVRPRTNKWLLGVGYGVAIWMCLLLTLTLAPQGETVLFALTPLSFGLSLMGHVVYGAGLALGLTLVGPQSARTANRNLRVL